MFESLLLHAAQHCDYLVLLQKLETLSKMEFFLHSVFAVLQEARCMVSYMVAVVKAIVCVVMTHGADYGR